MKMGVHRAELAAATRDADQVLWFQSAGMEWLAEMAAQSSVPAAVIDDLDALVEATLAATPMAAGGHGTHILIMSNGGFGGFHQKLVDRLGSAG